MNLIMFGRERSGEMRSDSIELTQSIYVKRKMIGSETMRPFCWKAFATTSQMNYSNERMQSARRMSMATTMKYESLSAQIDAWMELRDSHFSQWIQCLATISCWSQHRVLSLRKTTFQMAYRRKQPLQSYIFLWKWFLHWNGVISPLHAY